MKMIHCITTNLLALLCCCYAISINHTIEVIPSIAVPSGFHYPVIPYPMATRIKLKPTSPLTERQSKKIFACGVGPAKISTTQNRLVGATEAAKNSWPGMVAIKYLGRLICGGTLISHDRILTAAYCTIYFFPWDFYLLTVELGAHNIQPTSDAAVSIRLSGMSRHRSYDVQLGYNDIAILKLKLPVIYSNTVSPVCLPPVGTLDSYADQEAVIVGWGAINSADAGGSPVMSGVLKQSTITIVSQADCKALYGDVETDDTRICVKAATTTSCKGDNGGPLFVRSSATEPWIQVGIISSSVFTECYDVDTPVYYTRITAYASWIAKRNPF